MVKNHNPKYFKIFAFISGIPILIYEIIWIRQLSIVFGNTITATSIVIAVFMGGLGFGSLFYGKKVDRNTQPLKLFSLLQIGIAGSALVSFVVFNKLPLFQRILFWEIFTSAVPFVLVIIIASVCMIIPTLFMGGILPVLSKSLASDRQRIGQSIGLIYGLNTLGSIAGALVTGFFLIATFGQTISIIIAVLLNIMLAIVSRMRTSPLQTVQKKLENNQRKYADSSLIAIAGLTGFIGLSYEILWTRSLNIFLANSTYSITSIIIIFLCGISVGSLVYAKFLSKKKHTISVLAACQTIIGLYAIITACSLNNLPGFLYSIRNILHVPILRVLVPPVSLSLIVAFIPTLCMGISFPLICKLVSPALPKLGKSIGKVFLANTIGAIIGSIVAAFFLIPVAGVVKSIVFIAFINIFIGLFLIWKFTELKRIRTMITFGSVSLIALFFTWRAFHNYMILPPSIFRAKLRADKILFYKETSQGTVIVNEDRYTGIRACFINNSAVCGTTYDALKVVKFMGHLPFFINPQGKNVLIIGFGIGITSAAVGKHDVEKLDCVEICSGAKTAATFFNDFNDDIVKDPRVNFINDDGRHYVLLTQTKYDIISCDPTHPTLGCNNLYTLEYFKDCKRLLNTGGVICQYLPLHKLSLLEFQTLIKTFAEVFPHTTVWLAYSHGVLIGSEEKIEFDFAKFSTDVISLNDNILKDPYIIATSLILDENSVQDFVKNACLNTDDQPYLEFFSLKSLRHENWHLNLIALLDKRSDIFTTFQNVDDREKIKRYLKGQNLFYSSLVYKNRGELIKSVKALEQALKYNPENQEILMILNDELTKFQ